MRPPRLDRYLAANLLLWVVTYLSISTRMLGMEEPLLISAGDMAVRRAGVCLAAVGACALIQKILLAARPWRLGRRLALAAGLSLAGGAFYVGLNHVAFYVIAPRLAWTSGLKELTFALLVNFSVLVWPFIAWCAIVFALSYDEEVREKSLRLAQAQALAAESQNQMLRYQINPHFLFNTLNALSALILQKDHVRAELMVLSLSKFLRASLERNPGDKSPLAAEIEAQRQYLAIEQIRFGERLEFQDLAPAALGDALVPSLILQPLVENAVKHGVARSSAPVRIEISARLRGDRLFVTVGDDAAGDMALEVPRLGVGLENVRRRLAVLYGQAGALTCGRRDGGGFQAVIELPLERR